MNKRKGLPFYCFSPPVMLATFLIETVFLVYVLYRYKMNALSRLVSLLLLFLATFQLAEYNVCGGLGADAATWSKVGFVAITVLPPIGIHLIHVIAKKSWSNITGIAYGMAAAWVVIFALSEQVFGGHVCAGNYVIFTIKPGAGGLYLTYYYLWLIVGAYLCLKFARNIKKKNRQSLILLAIGYGTLLIPTTTANMLAPDTINALPSIMCGFAIILAAIITFGIMTRLGIKRK